MKTMKITSMAQDMVKDIKAYLKEYEDAEKIKMEARNNRDYDRALKTQECNYYDIYNRIEGLLKELNMLGLNIGVDDRLHNTYIIEDKKIF